LGDWDGERSRLLEHGVRFDFQYISDSLWNIKSEQQERFASWNRFRGTVDIDFGALVGQQVCISMRQHSGKRGNLGAYLGLLTSPSGMFEREYMSLDSCGWKTMVERNGSPHAWAQFAGQDFYGAQHDAASFIFEPMGYALGNLFTDFESFRSALYTGV